MTFVNIAEAIPALNRLQADGIVENYAVGGDAAASLYLESVSPRHVDVFVGLKPEPGKLIVDPAPIFKYLLERGAIIEGAHLRIDDTPLLFVPPPTPLLEEAMLQAIARDFDGEPGRVFSADHLAAIAFQSGRANARLLDYIAAGVLDVDRFTAIVTRHNLLDRWREFLRNQPWR